MPHNQPRNHAQNQATPQAAPPYHFEVIRRAIALIDAAQARGTALSLTDLAARMSMSPAHFQRLFTAWAGVSPKRYQQYLALDHARALLRDRFTTLATAQATGLSGTGRLHDLFARWEAMSPGEYARKGAGLAIDYGWFPSPFGEALAMATPKGLCGLGFTLERGRAATLADMRARWPRATFQPAPQRLAPMVSAAFAGTGRIDLHLLGAPFQLKVWEALLAIPPGHVTSYSQIGAAIGAPTAQRAIGTAVGRNPLGWLIPCHRVLRKSGGLGGYHWGLEVKRMMLAYEGARADAQG